MLMNCAHCGREFSATNLNRRYCCNSCNVLASYARNGRPGERAAELAEAKEQFDAALKEQAAARLAEGKKQLTAATKKLEAARLAEGKKKLAAASRK
jgi:hypothetical protein